MRTGEGSDDARSAAEDAASVIDQRLPARWRPWQRRKNTAIYLLLRAVAYLWQRLPRCCAGPLGTLLGLLADPLAWGPRRCADAQLARAWPNWSAGQRRTVRRQMFVHLARSCLELGRLDAWLVAPGAVELNPAARATLAAALAPGRGAIAVGGHLGNWELMAQALAHSGLPLSCIASPLYDPRLTHWLDQLRRRHGMRLIWRAQRSAVRGLLTALRQGRLLALLIDQDTRVAGTWVPFFGQPAFTPTAAATLALRRQVPLVVIWSRRQRGRHIIYAEAVTTDGPTGPLEVAALTAHLTSRLEAAIRQAPEQWVWMHQRWRTQRP